MGQMNATNDVISTIISLTDSQASSRLFAKDKRLTYMPFTFYAGARSSYPEKKAGR